MGHHLTDMLRTTSGLLIAATLMLAACGAETRLGFDDPDEPVLQIRSEGGFTTVEMALGRGPTYTLLADGRLIHTGPVIAIYPAPLLPNFLVGSITEDQMNEVLDLVDEIGLPDFTDETDETNGQGVADATTEIVTYWDESGAHTYSVYALGINDQPSDPRTAAFLELFNLMGELAATTDAEPYEGEKAQVIAGPGFPDPDFPDLREWPLDDDSLESWAVLPNGWHCDIEDPEVLDLFRDASQNTQWNHPEGDSLDPLTLLVRPLHPGEPDCFEE